MKAENRKQMKSHLDVETILTYCLASWLLAMGTIGLIAAMFEIDFNSIGIISLSSLVIGLTGIIWTIFIIYHLSK